MHPFTEAEIEDIKGREAKALEMLKELELVPACFIQKVSITSADGQEVFADKISSYLQDTKFTKPLKPEEAKEEIKDITPEAEAPTTE